MQVLVKFCLYNTFSSLALVLSVQVFRTNEDRERVKQSIAI